MAINVKPIPNATAARPNKAIAPATIISVPATGVNSFAATTSAVIPTAKETNAFNILSQDIFPKDFIPIANNINAAEATNKPPVLAPTLLIMLVANTNIVNAPAIAVNERPISSHDNLDNFFKPAPNINNEIVKGIIANALGRLHGGNLFMDKTNINNAPAIAVSDLAISPHDKEPNFFRAFPKIINDVVKGIIANPLTNDPLDMLFNATINIVIDPAIANNPLPISTIGILPIFFNAVAINIIANDIFIIAIDFDITPFLSGINFKANNNTLIAPAKPISPVII